MDEAERAFASAGSRPADVPQAETILHRISVAYPLYPRLNVGFGLCSRRGDEHTCWRWCV